jgi:group I intron endonuclease
MNSGIYKITNIINNKCYIGSAININKRWAVHRNSLLFNKHHSIYLQRVYNKYGITQLKYEVLLYCDKKDLLFYEQRAIDTYKPEYNLCKIAGSPAGRKASEETKAKMRAARKNISDETRAKLSAAGKGRISPNKGKSPSKETREKLSIAGKARKMSEDTKNKIAMSNTGKIRSEETKRKIGEASKLKIISEDTCNKMSVITKNRVRTVKGTFK